MELTHLNAKGQAHMVDVGHKPLTRRIAIAEAVVMMRPETLQRITQGEMPKGDVFAAARIAGIMAGKRTSELIPLCHPVPIDSMEVELQACPPDRIHIKATAGCAYRTGVEMEALTAATVAALTLYDMCKAIDRAMIIESVRLLEKSGGKSTYLREDTHI